MAALTPKQEELCATSRWDFSDLRAVYISCTLKRSPATSHTQWLADRSIAIMTEHGRGGIPATGTSARSGMRAAGSTTRTRSTADASSCELGHRRDPHPGADRPLGPARPDRRPLGVDVQTRHDRDLHGRGLRRRRVLLHARRHGPPVAHRLGRRALGSAVRGADARRHADPLRPLQPRRRAVPRRLRLLRLGHRVHPRAAAGRLAVAAQPAPGPARASAGRPCRAVVRGPGRARGRRLRRPGGSRVPGLAVDGDRRLALDADAADGARARLLHRAGRHRRAAALTR